MTNASLVPELDPKDQIQFVDSHRVALNAGDYTLTIGQEVKNGSKVEVSVAETKKTQDFSVLGERFELNPQTIHALFPPPGSRGDFWHALPHVILNRSTLPWERTALTSGGDAGTDPPWLALLLFHQDEAQDVVASTKTLKDLKPANGPSWPGITEESGQHDNDHCRVIDVPWAILKPLLPTDSDDMQYRTHARRRLAYVDLSEKKTKVKQADLDQDCSTITANATEVVKSISIRANLRRAAETQNIALSQHCRISKLLNPLRWHLNDLANHQQYEIWKNAEGHYDFYRVASEAAVIMGNRLPEPGKRNIVHLVSLEGRYDGGFDSQGAKPGDKVRLVSLKSWEFFCEDPSKDLKGILEGLNSKIVVPATSRLPIESTTAAENFLRAGFVPLPHFFRIGQASASWYHGPFVPKPPTSTDISWMQSGGEVNARAADALLLFDETSGIFDASYAAAWELGRMLTLQNNKVALDLFHWKRRHAHSLHAARRQLEYGHDLPVSQAHQTPVDVQTAASVDKWFHELSLLQHIPYNYLVPDDRLLPPESLRFFSVDAKWLECLLDGAFSIGRVLSSDAEREPGKVNANFPVSGLLLRSEAVSGWPGLQIDPYDKAADKSNRDHSDLGPGYPRLKFRRMERLSNDVLLCLFDGDVRMIDVHMRPETLHFGFDISDKAGTSDAPTSLVKYPRDANGNEYDPKVPVGIVLANTGRLAVDLKTLSANIQKKVLETDFPDFTPADFALQMVAGVELVRFIRP